MSATIIKLGEEHQLEDGSRMRLINTASGGALAAIFALDGTRMLEIRDKKSELVEAIFTCADGQSARTFYDGGRIVAAAAEDSRCRQKGSRLIDVLPRNTIAAFIQIEHI